MDHVGDLPEGEIERGAVTEVDLRKEVARSSAPAASCSIARSRRGSNPGHRTLVHGVLVCGLEDCWSSSAQVPREGRRALAEAGELAGWRPAARVAPCGGSWPGLGATPAPAPYGACWPPCRGVWHDDGGESGSDISRITAKDQVKGQDTQDNWTKRQFLDERVRAINAHGGFGTWAWDVSLSQDHLPAVLERHRPVAKQTTVS